MVVGQFATRIAAALCCLLMTACAHTSPAAAPDQSLHQHTEALAGSLLSSGSSSHAIEQRIGVGSLVPVHSLRQQGNGRDRVMVQQIQEGLISAAARQGAHIIEYRTSSQLRLDDGQELMLSRDVEDLSVRQRLDYFLTGTYSEVSGGLLVNVRLIDVRDNSVARAATHFFPWVSLQGDGEMSEIRHGQLYRHSTQSNSHEVYRAPAPQRAARY